MNYVLAKPRQQDEVELELSKQSKISIINLVKALIDTAHRKGASDIHIVPESTSIRVRLRIDGVLCDSYRISKQLHPEIVSRIKVLSRLRTDEHQATQDGRFQQEFSTPPEGEAGQNQWADIRVSIVPTYYGENVVLRILSEQADHSSLESLGFSTLDRKKITDALKKQSGMILATGPTGSGKTTTLYTLIKRLNSPEISIVTIEDPIEYAISGIEQIQVNARSGLSFSNGLRSILRQDPNIIMVGEIRDKETAHIAVNTALTGHLLLSTVHTNDAASTFPRLLDMGIEEYLVASTVRLCIGQRLVRKICAHCKEKTDIPTHMYDSLSSLNPNSFGARDFSLFIGRGCEQCNNTGYAGRVGIHEVLVADEPIRQAVLRKASSDEIRTIALQNGMTSMLADGFEKVTRGITTLEEILRVAHE